MARVVKTSKIRKQRIKEKEKELKMSLKKTGLSKRKAKKQAKATAEDVYEAEKQQRIAENRAKREARRAAMAARAESKKAMTNKKSRASVGFRNTYEKTMPDKTTKKLIKREPSKLSQQKNTNQYVFPTDRKLTRTEQTLKDYQEKFPNSKGKLTTNQKEKALRELRLREKESKMAKHGGALAIMIAPVKTKKMKAVKKGVHGAKVKKAPGGASMGKMKMMKKGGKLKPVPSEAKGLSKLPTSVRNKMGYMKNGGKMSARRKKPTSMSFEKMIEKNDNLNVAKTINQINRSGMSSDKAKKMIEKLKKRRMMYGGSMKKKMAMGGRMGSKEMMESMKKDDKMLKNGGKITKKKRAERAANQAKLNAEAKRLKEESLKKSKSSSVKKLKVKSSRRGEAVQAKEGIAEKATSGPQLVKYYMSKAGGGMSREQAVAKMVRAKTGKIPSDDGKSMVKQSKMMYGGAMKKAMYGAKMKKKAMYGAKMKKMENGGKVKKDLEKQKKDLLSKQNIMRYGDKESGFSKGSLEKMGVIAYQKKKRYNKPQTGVLNKKAISKRKVTPKVKKTNKR